MNSNPSTSMENSQFDTLTYKFSHSRRKSHLKSQTYQTMFQILSQYYQNPPQPSLETQIVPIELESGVNNRGEALEEGGGKDSEKVGLDSEGVESISIQEHNVIEVNGVRGGDDNRLQMAIEELEVIMNIEEDDEVLKKDGRINEDHFVDREKLIAEDTGYAEKVPADNVKCGSEVSISEELCLDKDMVNEVCKQRGSDDVKISSVEVGSLEEVGNQIQQKDGQPEKLDHINGEMGSPSSLSEDEEVEEGEISGDFGIPEQSTDLLLEDGVQSEENNVDRIFKDESEGMGCKLQERSVDVFKESTSHKLCISDYTDNGRVVKNSKEIECRSSSDLNEKPIKDTVAGGHNRLARAEIDTNLIGGNKEPFNCFKARGDPVFYGDILEEKASDNCRIQCIVKDDGISMKRKLGGNSKEKKKRNKRKKRAEKNRLLGVKRLKIQPISKPKVVKVCEHYLKGRCRKGDECSFSHDAVPLTKSKPCSHFARNSCMKGEDCPFDHQLSKYPCNNYATQGFCIRGDNCLFSHKVPIKEGSPPASDISKPELKLKPPPVPGVFPCMNDQNDAMAVVKPPTRTPKGISFISLGKSSSGSSEPKVVMSSSEVENITLDYLTIQSGSIIVQNPDHTPKGNLLPEAPRGINSFWSGKSPSDYSSSKNQNASPLNNTEVINISPLDDFSKLKPSGSSPKRSSGVKDGNQKEKSSSVAPQGNEIPMTSSPAKAPRGINFLQFGKVSEDDSSGKTQVSLPSNQDSVTKLCIQEKKSTFPKLQSSVSIPWKMPVSPPSSAQSSGGNKNMTSLAQKALLSTLAFASKYESHLNMDRSNNGPDRHAENGKVSGSGSRSGNSHNEPMKASTILDFIFGSGGKTKL